MSLRTERLSKLLQQQMSLLIFKLKKQPPALITITGVKISPDIKSATVYFSVMDESEIANTQKILEGSKKFFSQHLSKVIRTKNFPKLSFEYDETPKKATRIFEIFEKLEKEKKEC